jgi:hypothetical protein
MRIVEERHDIMEFMMEVLMNKFDEMISNKEVLVVSKRKLKCLPLGLQ